MTAPVQESESSAKPSDDEAVAIEEVVRQRAAVEGAALDATHGKSDKAADVSSPVLLKIYTEALEGNFFPKAYWRRAARNKAIDLFRSDAKRTERELRVIGIVPDLDDEASATDRTLGLSPYEEDVFLILVQIERELNDHPLKMRCLRVAYCASHGIPQSEMQSLLGLTAAEIRTALRTLRTLSCLGGSSSHGT